jgi:hypothetical protein
MAQKVKTDLVMALWFGHIAFTKILERAGKKKQTHMASPFLTPNARSQQQVISISALRRQKQLELEERRGVG